MTEEELLKSATDVAKVLATEVYNDSLKPGMTQIGKALGSIIEFGRIALLPIEFVNDRVKLIRAQNYSRLQQKLETIREENIIEIHPEIAVPVLQKLEYTENKELSELFLNLLSTASNIETAHLAHPSFVNVISNLSPDEAKLLEYISNNGSLCFASIRSSNKDGSYSDYMLGTTILEFEEIIQFKQNSKIYISNLIGLGIIKEFALPNSNPQTPKLHSFLAEEMENVSKLDKVKSQFFNGGCYNLTEFGKLFMSCCS